jgi:hypothetical protein
MAVLPPADSTSKSISIFPSVTTTTTPHIPQFLFQGPLLFVVGVITPSMVAFLLLMVWLGLGLD